QVHFVELRPGGSNHGHGHQNEATFYILDGSGYEIHDGVRYDWSKDDFVVVHNDSVHRHYNASQTERALALVIKAKSAWMYLGMVQQGRSKPFDGAGYGAPQEWSRLWTPGATERKKVVRSADTAWENTRDGRVRVISSPARTDVRAFSVDLYEQEIRAGGRSAKHWHMSDEVCYGISGGARVTLRSHARIPRQHLALLRRPGPDPLPPVDTDLGGVPPGQGRQPHADRGPRERRMGPERGARGAERRDRGPLGTQGLDGARHVPLLDGDVAHPRGSAVTDVHPRTRVVEHIVRVHQRRRHGVPVRQSQSGRSCFT